MPARHDHSDGSARRARATRVGRRQDREEREADRLARRATVAVPLLMDLPRAGPLDAGAAGRLGTALGADLSGVRIFRDEAARARAEALHALAFTHGQDIYFGRRAQGPRVPSALLAHELVHTLQPGAATTLRLSDDDWGFTDFLWEVLVGDFEEDASISATVVRALIGLIPYADQVLDAEDLVANLYHLVWEERYDEVLLWVALILTLIGCIPEAGSAIKGTAKSVLKALRSVGLEDAISWLRRLGLMDTLQSGLRRLDELVAALPELGARAREQLADLLRRAQTGVSDMVRQAGSVLSDAWRRRLDQLQRAIERARTELPTRAEAALRWLRVQVGELVARLRGRRVAAPADVSIHRVGPPGTIPRRYADDPTFDALAHDPAHGARPRPVDQAKARREAMAGLEATHGGHLRAPLTRDPTGNVEFFDADGHPWDVKTPASPRPGERPGDARWTFEGASPWEAIIEELRKTPVANPVTGALEPRGVLLDVTYLRPEDHARLWRELHDALAPDELARIVELNVRL